MNVRKGVVFVQMQEKYDSVNTITTVSGDILDGVIDYIYTGVAKLTEDNVYEMLDAAEFTQVAGKCCGY